MSDTLVPPRKNIPSFKNPDSTYDIVSSDEEEPALYSASGKGRLSKDEVEKKGSKLRSDEDIAVTTGTVRSTIDSTQTSLSQTQIQSAHTQTKLREQDANRTVVSHQRPRSQPAEHEEASASIGSIPTDEHLKLQQEAKNGNAACQLALSGMERREFADKPSNLAKSAYWLLRSARQNFPQALAELARIRQDGPLELQYEIARYYEQGLRADEGLPKVEGSLEEAAPWYKIVAEQNEVDAEFKSAHAEAQFQYACCLSKGTGVAIDQSRAWDFCENAAFQGNESAQYAIATSYTKSGSRYEKVGIYYLLKLANVYRYGGLPGKAREELDRIKKNGPLNLQCQIAEIYRRGAKVSDELPSLAANPRRAAEWYESIAKQTDVDAKYQKEHAEALYQYALCFKKGDGVIKDRQMALWYRDRASFIGNDRAQNWLAKSLSANGELHDCAYWLRRSVLQSNKNAIEKLENAERNGSSKLQYQIAESYRRGLPAERCLPEVSGSLEEAAPWYKLVAEQNEVDAEFKSAHAEAQFQYACCLSKGIGVGIDPEGANDYLRKAANQNHELAQQSLASGVLRIETNPEKFQRELEMAASNADALSLTTGRKLAISCVQALEREDDGAKNEFDNIIRDGDPDLRLNICNLCLDKYKQYKDGGDGVERDPGESAKWLRWAEMASHDGAYREKRRLEQEFNPELHFALYSLYADGAKSNNDQLIAACWLVLAADEENPGAKAVLAQIEKNSTEADNPKMCLAVSRAYYHFSFDNRHFSTLNTSNTSNMSAVDREYLYWLVLAEQCNQPTELNDVCRRRPNWQFEVAEMYRRGHRQIEPDKWLAKMHYTLALEYGHPNAQEKLDELAGFEEVNKVYNDAMALLDKPGNSDEKVQNTKESLDLLKHADENGHDLAAYHIGQICLYGWAGDKDYPAAEKYLRKAAARGNARIRDQAQFLLGQLYAKGYANAPANDELADVSLKHYKTSRNNTPNRSPRQSPRALRTADRGKGLRVPSGTIPNNTPNKEQTRQIDATTAAAGSNGNNIERANQNTAPQEQEQPDFPVIDDNNNAAGMDEEYEFFLNYYEGRNGHPRDLARAAEFLVVSERNGSVFAKNKLDELHQNADRNRDFFYHFAKAISEFEDATMGQLRTAIGICENNLNDYGHATEIILQGLKAGLERRGPEDDRSNPNPVEQANAELGPAGLPSAVQNEANPNRAQSENSQEADDSVYRNNALSEVNNLILANDAYRAALNGAKQDPEDVAERLALALAQKAAKGNDQDLQVVANSPENSTLHFALFCVYRTGRRGVQPDPFEAAKWLALAAQEGDPRALMTLELFQDASNETDDREICFALNQVYQSGVNMVQHDNDTALYWLALAGEKGHPTAKRELQDIKLGNDPNFLFTLGEIYQEGFEGKGWNLQEALVYFRKAAELGYGPAQRKLANMRRLEVNSTSYLSQFTSKRRVNALYQDENAETKNRALQELNEKANSDFLRSIDSEFGNDVADEKLEPGSLLGSNAADPASFKAPALAGVPQAFDKEFLLGQVLTAESVNGAGAAAEAKKVLDLIKQTGSSEEQYFLGQLYLKGERGVDANLTEAIHFLGAAMFNEDGVKRAEAQKDLLGIKHDPKLEIPDALEANGDADYLRGVLEEADGKLLVAEGFYKAAIGGRNLEAKKIDNPYAHYRLACLYRDGDLQVLKSPRPDQLPNSLPSWSLDQIELEDTNEEAEPRETAKQRTAGDAGDHLLGAASGNHIGAQFQLAMYFYDSVGHGSLTAFKDNKPVDKDDKANGWRSRKKYKKENENDERRKRGSEWLLRAASRRSRVAERELDRILEKTSSVADILEKKFWIAEAYRNRLKRIDTAVNIYRDVIDKSGRTHTGALYKLGRALLDHNDLKTENDDPIGLLREASDRGQREASYDLGRYYYEQSNFVDAKRYLERACATTTDYENIIGADGHEDRLIAKFGLLQNRYTEFVEDKFDILSASLHDAHYKLAHIYMREAKARAAALSQSRDIDEDLRRTIINDSEYRSARENANDQFKSLRENYRDVKRRKSLIVNPKALVAAPDI